MVASFQIEYWLDCDKNLDGLSARALKMSANKPKIKKILVIEDQVDIRMLIKMTLNFDYYEIHEAFDAQMGLDMVHAINPDLVLLDIMMPVPLALGVPVIKDGLDLCRHLKSDPEYSAMPIIFLTAKGQSVDKSLGFDAGADEYVVKPFSPIYVIEVVDRLISKGCLS